MVDARGQNNHVVLVQADADPLIVLPSHVEVPLAVEDVPDFLIFVQVLGEEHLYFFFVNVAHSRWRHAHLVAVLVAPLGGELVDGFEGRAVVVHHTQGGKLVFRDGAAGVVRLALVAL